MFKVVVDTPGDAHDVKAPWCHYCTDQSMTYITKFSTFS